LRYFIRTPNHYDFHSGLSAAGVTGDFEYRFRWHEATFFPRTQFVTIEDARSCLDLLLEAWYVNALVEFGPAAPSFSFFRAAMETYPGDPNGLAIPKQPMPPTNLTLWFDRYPSPPIGLGVDDCVRDLAEHVLASEQTSRSILLHAYAIVTRVSVKHGGIQKVAADLNISVDRLTYTKHLASVRGVGGGARKFEPNRPRLPVSTNEFVWLRITIIEILRRSACLAAGYSPGEQLNGRPEPEPRSGV
jgi:hypothetical protein